MPSGATAALAAGTAIPAMAWAVRGRSSSVFAPSVWRGKTGRNALALTFDDGPSPATPALLRLLGEFKVPATFFQISANVLAYPEIARQVLAEGHEIGNHTHSHPLLALKSSCFIYTEFARAQEIIGAATGHEPRLLRPPFGVRWFGFRQMQRRLRLTSVMWTVIGRDWKLRADAIARRVLHGACDGGIVCLHDGRGTLKNPDVQATLEAVRSFLPDLLAKGYHFETVTQLLCPMK